MPAKLHFEQFQKKGPVIKASPEDNTRAHGVTAYLQGRQGRLFRRSAAEKMEAIIAIAE